MNERTDVEVRHGGETLVLHHDCTAHWEHERVLFVADTHFGKTAAFRAGGVPVPEQTTLRDLDRLSCALARTGAQRLIVLGDFLHAKAGRTEPVHAAIDAWRNEHPALDIVLVRGNHDRNAGDPFEEWAIRCVDPGHALGPFTLLHEPPEGETAVTGGLAGHLHPAVRMLDPGTRSGVRLACFWRRPCSLVLPAFGSFTGMHIVRPRVTDEVCVCTEDAVLRVPTAIVRR